MNLSKKYISMILTTCLFVLLISACGSHEEKADEAFDLVKKEKMMSADTTNLSEVIIQQPGGTDLLNRTVNLDEWAKYRIEIERKIHSNGNKIKAIKDISYTNDSLLLKITGLENENNYLIIKMDQFNEEVKLKREQFKVSMNQNLNKIRIELNTMRVINKK